MTRFLNALFFGTPLILLSACQSFSLDKDRSAEHRKQALCGEIGTHDLPHCASYATGLQDEAIESLRRMENPPPTEKTLGNKIKETIEQRISDQTNTPPNGA